MGDLQDLVGWSELVLVLGQGDSTSAALAAVPTAMPAYNYQAEQILYTQTSSEQKGFLERSAQPVIYSNAAETTTTIAPQQASEQRARAEVEQRARAEAARQPNKVLRLSDLILRKLQEYLQSKLRPSNHHLSYHSIFPLASNQFCCSECNLNHTNCYYSCSCSSSCCFRRSCFS